MSNNTEELRYRVEAERLQRFSTNPTDKGYASKFIQDFSSSSEAFKTYFELLPEFTSVTITDLVKQKTVVLND